MEVNTTIFYISRNQTLLLWTIFGRRASTFTLEVKPKEETPAILPKGSAPEECHCFGTVWEVWNVEADVCEL